MLIALNKPFGVICQFSPSGDKPTLKQFVSLGGVYPAGRLDTDSEGLLLLTDDGILQARIADPRHKLVKTYLVQVEGIPADFQLDMLRQGVDLGDFVALPAMVRRLAAAPDLWERDPPVRFRREIPTCWLEISIGEGKNRQVRRMTAKAGFPTLRLVRTAIGPIHLGTLAPGKWREIDPALLSGPNARRPKTPEK